MCHKDSWFCLLISPSPRNKARQLKYFLVSNMFHWSSPPGSECSMNAFSIAFYTLNGVLSLTMKKSRIGCPFRSAEYAIFIFTFMTRKAPIRSQMCQLLLMGSGGIGTNFPLAAMIVWLGWIFKIVLILNRLLP